MRFPLTADGRPTSALNSVATFLCSAIWHVSEISDISILLYVAAYTLLLGAGILSRLLPLLPFRRLYVRISIR